MAGWKSDITLENGKILQQEKIDEVKKEIDKVVSQKLSSEYRTREVILVILEEYKNDLDRKEIIL